MAQAIKNILQTIPVFDRFLIEPNKQEGVAYGPTRINNIWYGNVDEHTWYSIVELGKQADVDTQWLLKPAIQKSYGALYT